MANAKQISLYRSRFRGRDDVFGCSAGPGQPYMPACENLWTASCHLRLKDGQGCAVCEVKKYIPVSDESVLRAIQGEQIQIQYMLQLDGTVRFSALDLDCKPGKEEKGYSFDDLRHITKILKEWGIPYGIARSTTSGFHIYMLFDEPCSAAKFRTVMYHLFERCGYMEQSRQGVRAKPGGAQDRLVA